jgi:hypothetical protein
MAPDIDANWAVVGTNAALHASSRVRNDMACDQGFSSISFFAKNTFKHYTSIVIAFTTRMAAQAAAGVIWNALFIVLFVQLTLIMAVKTGP